MVGFCQFRDKGDPKEKGKLGGSLLVIGDDIMLDHAWLDYEINLK